MSEIGSVYDKLGVRTEIFGNKSLIVEGCDCVVDYRPDGIKLRSGRMCIEIKGKGLKITRLTESSASVSGSIHSVRFNY